MRRWERRGLLRALASDFFSLMRLHLDSVFFRHSFTATRLYMARASRLHI
jgi:hypothetical protein